MGRVFVLAPWGDPANWHYVEYVLESRNDKVVVKSFTSLTALATVYKGANIVIIVADTLANPQASDYDSVLRSAEAYARRYLCGLEASVLVLPGVIWQSNRVFEGSATDYYYTLLARMLDGATKGEPIDTIVLDLTHGINYMPSLALKAAEEAASILSLVKALTGEGDSTELVVYNSDPVIPPRDVRERLKRSKEDPCKPQGIDTEPLRAKLNRVFRRRYTVLDLISNIESMELKRAVDALKATSRECTIDRNIVRELRNATLEAKRILKMLRHGLVPELLYYVSKNGEKLQEGLEKALDDVRRLWLEGVVVENADGRLRVRRCRRLDEGYRILLYAYNILGPLRKLVETYTPEIGISIDVAKALQKALSRSTAIKTIQDREMSKLEKAAKEGKIPASWTLLAEVYNQQTIQYKDKEMFKRDLLAHGGWHTDVIEVRRGVESEILYRVNEDIEIKRERISIWELVDEL